MKARLAKAVATAASTTVAATGVTVATVGTAHAATCAGVTISSLAGPSIAIDERTPPINMRMRSSMAGGLDSWTATGADVYRGSKKVGTLPLPPAASSSPKRFGFTFHSGWGRGYFTVRNIHIQAATYTTGTGYTTKSCTMNVPNRFRVRSKVAGALPYNGLMKISVPLTRSTKHTFKIGLRHYTTHGWSRLKHYRVRIQEKRSGHWKTIKKLRTDKRGKARWITHIKGEHWFRLAWHGTSTIAGGTNKYATRM